MGEVAWGELSSSRPMAGSPKDNLLLRLTTLSVQFGTTGAHTHIWEGWNGRIGTDPSLRLVG